MPQEIDNIMKNETNQIIMILVMVISGTLTLTEDQISAITNIVFGGTASIRNNTATENGGGVSLDGALTFTMNAGTISGNTTKYGAGVIIFNNGTFYLKGGNITSNTASINTGGIDVNYGKLYVQGGNVTNNPSTYLSGIFYCSNRSTYSYTSGTISGNSPTNVMSNTCN